MEGIKTFNIEIDLNDRDTLYDYGKCEYVQKPADGKWDLADLSMRAKHTLDKNNETVVSRIEKMDKSFTAKVTLQKDKTEDAGKGDDASEELDKTWGGYDPTDGEHPLPRRVLPIYKPGETVRGHLVLELTDKLDAEKLRLTFKGRAVVMVRVYHSKGH